MPRSRPATKTQPGAGSTTDHVADGARPFFEELQDRAYEPILRGETGSLRFDLRREPGLDHWYIAIADGNISVSHSRSRADTVVKVEGELFDRIAQGRANAMAAQLRGALAVEGDLHLLMVFQRLFPGPPRSSTATRPARARRKGSK